jgi:hypothetical protein
VSTPFFSSRLYGVGVPGRVQTFRRQSPGLLLRTDSPLEGAGFEPSIPRRGDGCRAPGPTAQEARADARGVRLCSIPLVTQDEALIRGEEAGCLLRVVTAAIIELRRARVTMPVGFLPAIVSSAAASSTLRACVFETQGSSPHRD